MYGKVEIIDAKCDFLPVETGEVTQVWQENIQNVDSEAKRVEGNNLPAISTDVGGAGNLSHYLNSIAKYPLLDVQEEQILAIRLREQGDLQAAHKLVTSHLRLVAKIAFGYRGYGLPVADLVSEGNLGLLQAVKNYNSEKGARLSTYAMWWIKASIHEYILRSWSLVKIGTTSAQKKLFFNLKRLKEKVKRCDNGYYLTDGEVHSIANELSVSETDVRQMEARMDGLDQSLNTQIIQGEGDDWQSRIVDERANQEENLLETNEKKYNNQLLYRAIEGLKQREREIIIARKLLEKPKTLEELSADYGVSRERIRQLEGQAVQNLKKALLAITEQPLLQ